MSCSLRPAQQANRFAELGDGAEGMQFALRFPARMQASMALSNERPARSARLLPTPWRMPAREGAEPPPD
jgi:hypothetical protein